jgi:uncharacterized Zn-finger protein
MLLELFQINAIVSFHPEISPYCSLLLDHSSLPSLAQSDTPVCSVHSSHQSIPTKTSQRAQHGTHHQTSPPAPLPSLVNCFFFLLAPILVSHYQRRYGVSRSAELSKHPMPGNNGKNLGIPHVQDGAEPAFRDDGKGDGEGRGQGCGGGAVSGTSRYEDDELLVQQ